MTPPPGSVRSNPHRHELTHSRPDNPSRSPPMKESPRAPLDGWRSVARLWAGGLTWSTLHRESAVAGWAGPTVGTFDHSDATDRSSQWPLRALDRWDAVEAD